MPDTKELTVIKRYQDEGALVFIDENDLQPQRMFRTIHTKIPVTKSDFHVQPINGQMMPKAHHVHRIAEAAGVTFETIDIKKHETSWTVTVRAFRRGPDGTIHHADSSYDYDWVDRVKDGPKKFALQRAETGAQLRSIRKILGMPVAFDRDNFERAVAVCRIVVDTDAMLQDEGMRRAAIDHAVGARSTLYGPARDVTPQREALEAPEETAPASDFEDDEEPDAPAAEPEAPKADPERLSTWKAIEDYEAAFELSGKALDAIAKLRARNLAEVPVEDLQYVLTNVKGYCERHQEKAR